jgi:hypothetical protein
MQRSQISQHIQMGSIGISDTTSVDSACYPEEMAHCRPAGGVSPVRVIRVRAVGLQSGDGGIMSPSACAAAAALRHT